MIQSFRSNMKNLFLILFNKLKSFFYFIEYYFFGEARTNS